MIKFFKGPMEAIENVEIFPIISFIIFFVFFIGLLVHVITLSKKTVAEVSQLPLEKDEPTSNHQAS